MPTPTRNITSNELWKEIIQDLNYWSRSIDAAAERRGAASFRHAPAPFQAEQEIDVCEDLGHSLFAQGKGDLREIRKNEIRNFPDCLARLDDEPVGIEVCELMDSHQAHTAWSIDRFSKKLGDTIRFKDGKAGKDDRPQFLASLSQLILVVHTDETALTPEILMEYLHQIRLPKPKRIDRAFVLSPYQPADRPAVRGHEHEPVDAPPSCTAFPVLWTTAESREIVA